MTLKSAKKLTLWLILMTALVWIGYDAYVYLYVSNAATESATIWNYAYNLPSLPFVFGILVGHLFLQQRAPSTGSVSQPRWNAIGQAITFFLGLIWLAIDIMLYSVKGHGLFTFHYPEVTLLLGLGVGELFYQMHEATQ